MNVLVINAGSSSLKYQLVNVEQQELLAKGICERVGSAEAFHKHGLDKNEEVIDAKMADHDDAMALVLESLTSGPTKAIDSLEEIDAVGHRIVQGGKYFDRSVLIDDDVIQKIDELAELAPLHNKAALMGINVNFVAIVIFALSGAAAGLAGCFYGMKYSVYPNMGNVAMKGFVASTVGGLGSLPGAVFSGLLLGFLETMISSYVSTTYRDLVAYGLLVLVLIFKPNGLFGKGVHDKL